MRLTVFSWLVTGEHLQVLLEQSSDSFIDFLIILLQCVVVTKLYSTRDERHSPSFHHPTLQSRQRGHCHCGSPSQQHPSQSTMLQVFWMRAEPKTGFHDLYACTYTIHVQVFGRYELTNLSSAGLFSFSLFFLVTYLSRSFRVLASTFTWGHTTTQQVQFFTET